ncbi:MAG: DUF2809 domain-containing protein [Janthinobacterium lividum]
MKTRNRSFYFRLLCLTIFLGLASRRFSSHLPLWLAKNAGDVLYATMVFWLVGFLFPRLSTIRCAIVSGLFCFGIEFLKFCNFPWLVAARHSHLGALVFGVGFHVSNLACYGIGAALAAGLERIYQQSRR